MYKSMGAKDSNWQLSQNNQYVSYALLSLEGPVCATYAYADAKRLHNFGQFNAF